MILENPSITWEELSDALKEEGLPLSALAVSTIRSEFLADIKLLNSLGYTKIPLNQPPRVDISWFRLQKPRKRRKRPADKWAKPRKRAFKPWWMHDES
jgi:hypothetical protein